MALITRVARLFRADFHAVLDRVEEPDLLLRQALREMETCLTEDEVQLERLRREESGLQAKVTDLEQRMAGLESELDICFAEGQETLARPLIRRNLEQQALCRQLRQRGRELELEREALVQRLDDNRQQYESLRQKAELYAPEEPQPERSWHQADVSVREEDVEIAFLRERQRRVDA